MISQKPYLIRAIHQWCSDNDLTPYLETVVNSNTIVPNYLVKDNKIVLNMSKNATRDLDLGLSSIQFKATFSGEIIDISIPIDNVISIFAKEQSQGLQFEVNTKELISQGKKPTGLKFVK